MTNPYFRDRICLRYQEARDDRLAFSCECDGGCPFRPTTTPTDVPPTLPVTTTEATLP